jgi:predicted small secreted protein
MFVKLPKQNKESLNMQTNIIRSYFRARAFGLSVVTSLTLLTAIGCTNTVTGMGKDIQKMGQSMNSQSSSAGAAANAKPNPKPNPNPNDSLSQGKDVVVTPVVVTPGK